MFRPAFSPGVGVAPAAWGEFVALPENRSALRAVRRICGPTAGPMPLVLHGPPGTGKSLLVQTLLRKLAARPDGRSAQVIPAAELAEETDPHACDVLAVEDVQHLPHRAADGLCRVLDRRTALRRPTLLTATAGPAGLTRLPRRLTSRLAGGLVVQLEPLSPASRRTLLERVAAKRKLPLTDDALDWLAAQTTGGGARPLLGQLERLRILTSGFIGTLDAAATRELLAEGQPTSRRGTVERIVERVATAFGVKPKELLGSCRQRSVLLPRQVAMYLARDVAKLSLPQVGAAFGRDHTTVLHACRKVGEALKADAKLKRTLRELAAELG